MEQNTKPVTLEEMASKHIAWLCKDGDDMDWTRKELEHLIICGGQWQKEQDKELFEAAKIGLDYIKTYMSLMGQNTKREPEPGSALDKVVKAIDKYNY